VEESLTKEEGVSTKEREREREKPKNQQSRKKSVYMFEMVKV
jgi:hypothetical protein